MSRSITIIAGLCVAFALCAAEAAAQPAQDASAAAAAAGAKEEVPVVEYTADQEFDPFKPEQETAPKAEVRAKPVQEKPLPVLTVQGIIWGGVFPQAIVNNKIVRIGDSIEETRIVDISKNGVVIFFNEREYTVTPVGLIDRETGTKK